MADNYFVKISQDAAANILLYCRFRWLHRVCVLRPRYTGRGHRGSHIGRRKDSPRLSALGLQNLHKMPAEAKETSRRTWGFRLDQTTFLWGDKSDQIV